MCSTAGAVVSVVVTLSDMTVLEKLEQFVTPLLATIKGALPDAG